MMLIEEYIVKIASKLLEKDMNELCVILSRHENKHFIFMKRIKK